MAAALSQRTALATSLLFALALAFGALIGIKPLAGLAVAGLCLVLALAAVAPVTHLMLVLFLSMIVPFSVQKAYAIGVSEDAPGVFVADILMVVGLIRVAPELMRMRLDRRRVLAAIAITVFMAVAFVQMLHGLDAGWDRSAAGTEGRVFLYYGTFLLAVPILSDDRARPRLLKALLGLGLALGLWGIAQWVFSFQFQAAGDTGLRSGVPFTSAGRGQVQGGLFAFPVALVIALAVLMSGQIRSTRARVLLLLVAALNAISLLLTYERTWWVAATIATAVVALRAGRLHRTRALVWLVSLVAVVFLSLSTLGPGVLTAARERLLSLGQYGNDNSLRYRIVESRHVIEQTRIHPLIGSGLGATIFWGRPWDQVPAQSWTYSHNGYLALAWKLGIPAALLLIALLVWSVLARGPPPGGPRYGALRNGCQGGLLVLLIASVTFPSFTTLGITGAIGLMLAVCAMPRAR